MRVARSLDAAFLRGKIVISATGTITIDEDSVHKLPHGTILFNAASEGSEFAFDRHRLSKPLDEAEVRRGAPGFLGGLLSFDVTRGSSDRVLHTRSGEVLMAADGDVINFGDEDPIPPRYIQLTRGLLYLG